MKTCHEPVPDSVTVEDDEGPVLPAAEALLAGTLALMTGYGEHRPPAARAGGAAACAAGALPHRMAAKVASNLFFLSQHPELSPAFRATLWRLRGHWQALERSTAAALPVQEDGADPARASLPWLPASSTRH